MISFDVLAAVAVTGEASGSSMYTIDAFWFLTCTRLNYDPKEGASSSCSIFQKGSIYLS
jgi:hypothetical protein